MKYPRRISPAFVVSLIALFVSLGTGAYAALNLPANSVGSQQLKNGAVTHSKLAHNAVTGSNIKGGTVPKATNALHLAGAAAGAYQRRCRPGGVAAYVYVKGFASFSRTYTTTDNLQDKFNCTGGIVAVKRDSPGVYDVHFGGLDTGPILIAVGNQSVDPLGSPVLGGALTFQLATDNTINGGSGGIIYRVTLTNASAHPVDNEFSFALLSPT